MLLMINKQDIHKKTPINLKIFMSCIKINANIKEGEKVNIMPSL